MDTTPLFQDLSLISEEDMNRFVSSLDHYVQDGTYALLVKSEMTRLDTELPMSVFGTYLARYQLNMISIVSNVYRNGFGVPIERNSPFLQDDEFLKKLTVILFKHFYLSIKKNPRFWEKIINQRYAQDGLKELYPHRNWVRVKSIQKTAIGRVSRPRKLFPQVSIQGRVQLEDTILTSQIGPSGRVAQEDVDAIRLEQQVELGRFNQKYRGQGGHNSNLMWHQYANYLEVSALDGVGRVRKMVPGFQLYFRPEDLKVEPLRALARLIESAKSPARTYHAMRDDAVRFSRENPEVRFDEFVRKGTTLVHPALRIKGVFRDGSYESDPKNTIFSWRAGQDARMGWPSSPRDSKQVYEWVTANQDRIRNMAWVEIWHAVQQETGVSMSTH